MTTRRRWVAASVLVLGLALVAAGCESSDNPSGPKHSAKPAKPPKPTKPTKLTFGVFGPPAEIDAFRAMVASYNDRAVTAHVDLLSWPDRDAMVSAIADGQRVPDLFMVSRRDLAQVQADEVNAPLFDLLDERGVSYGDRYARDALEAFSIGGELQCMPYSASPMVIYYNTDLIDFEKMAARELPVPDPETQEWTFDGFRAAAEFASRRRAGTKGVYVDPTLRGLAPFLLSGGGKLFDDDDLPTTLTLSDANNTEPLTRTLELLRDPVVTLSNQQLTQATPLDYFEDGKLGMIEGYRSLTPTLRGVPGLHFDVLPMPSFDSPSTIGDTTGLCIARGVNVAKTADFLVHTISDESFESVAAAGYIVPANQLVARSQAFLQPEEQPAHAGVFNASVDDMRPLPLLGDFDELNAAVGPSLRRLLTAPVIDDLATLTAEIDGESRAVLDPAYVPESPTDSSSESSSP